jgi:hypothetical protein
MAVGITLDFFLALPSSLEVGEAAWQDDVANKQ